MTNKKVDKRFTVTTVETDLTTNKISRHLTTLRAIKEALLFTPEANKIKVGQTITNIIRLYSGITCVCTVTRVQ